MTVTNSGNATLHITSVVVAGNNPSDFVSSTSNCVGTFSANASCALTMTFAPLAAGQRSETITLTDDASDSPQVLNVGGNANPAFIAGPIQGSSTTASVSPGQTAQYQMQLTPGSGYSGTISFTCTGAPLGAICQPPRACQFQMPFHPRLPSLFLPRVAPFSHSQNPHAVPLPARFRCSCFSHSLYFCQQ